MDSISILHMVNKPNIYIYIYKGGITIGIFKNNSGQVGVGIVIFAVLAIAAVLMLNPFVQIDAGERGVVKQWGAVQEEELNEGFNFKLPIRDTIARVNVKTLKYEATESAASKDLQNTKTTIAVNYHILPSMASDIIQTVGDDYENVIIRPAIQEAVKASTAKFIAGELITKREVVKADIEAYLIPVMLERGVVIESIFLTDFEYSADFNAAIESKVKAEQKALQAVNDLARIKIEAEQVVVKAQADADAIALIDEQLSKSPKYIDYLAVNAWDGVLPRVTGGVVPMVDVAGIAAEA